MKDEHQDRKAMAVAKGDSAAVEIPEPTAPTGMTDEDVAQVKSQAAELVQQLEGATGSKELELVDNVTHVGAQSQRAAGAELDLLKARVGVMLSAGGASADISKGLIDLRLALNQINPHQLSSGRGFFSRLSFVPFVRRGKPAVRALQKIAMRYEPVSKQVGAIETKLRDSRAVLVKDNVELRKLYEQVEAQQLPVQRRAYLGEVLMQELSELLERTDDVGKRERSQGALHDVAMRVQDLRTMETVYGQYFVSIEMTRQNNNRLGQSVERTLSLATNVVMVGLAIQGALIRQRKVMDATRRTREFLGELIVANAASIKRHTEDIGDLYNNPVIAIDKITKAHDDLLEALDMAGRLREEGIAKATENIALLTQKSNEIQTRIHGLPAAEPAALISSGG